MSRALQAAMCSYSLLGIPTETGYTGIAAKERLAAVRLLSWWLRCSVIPPSFHDQ
jgi:hypothetical protein